MHRCLSCNQTCSISSIFCDACRDSLLERNAGGNGEEQPELVKAGSMERGTGGLALSPQRETATTGLESAPCLGTAAEAEAECEQEYTPAQADEQRSWLLETSGIHKVETVEEVAENMDETEPEAGVAQSTHMLAVPLLARRKMPRGVRRALLVFCVVGVLALLTDGALLALSIMRHRGTPPINQDAVGIMHQLSPTAGGGTVSPASHTDSANKAGTLLLSSTRLTFTVTQDQTDVPSQTVTFSGGAQHTFSWLIVPATTFPNWLHLSAMRGNATVGVTPAVMVNVEPAQLTPGTYTTRLLVKAFDTHGKELADSPEALNIALNVRTPCSLSVSPEKLSFAVVLLSAPSPQTLTLTESSSCAFPVSWRASADASWVILSSTSGVDTSSGGSVTVQVSSAGKLIGTYTAHITLLATDSSGAPVTVSPEVVTVTLTVLG